MKITEYAKEHIIYLDGAMGTMLQAGGLKPGELPERLNVTHPEKITEIHKAYFDAGSNLVCTNTFGANTLKFSRDELREIIGAAVHSANSAREQSRGGEKWIALDIGPLGRMLAPYGDLDFEEAVKIFAETVKIGAECAVDLILIETMNDIYETKAALLAAKENCDLPVFVLNAYSEDGKLLTSAEPGAVIAMLEGMGADAVGINCSFGPQKLRGVAEEYLRLSSGYVIFKPNAGLPQVSGGITRYDLSPDEFADEITELLRSGVRMAGGCCGTTPEYIAALVKKSEKLAPVPVEDKNITCVSSYTHAVTFGKKPVLIGERINPTGKKRFKEALREGDFDYILGVGFAEQEQGAHILDVNVGLPEIDEVDMLTKAVCKLQAVIDLPLQIDSSNTEALASALRRYNGKALINSVNGKAESMKAVFPLAKKYGGLTVALTLDENGIPETAEGRVRIAEKILAEAQKYGIERKNIIFDPLALTVSADKNAANETLKAVRLIRERLGCHTSLGISNVSFGLPKRDIVNGAFFTLALGNGLSAAIVNPDSAELKKAYFAYCALCGLDDNCGDYISFAETLPDGFAAAPAVAAEPKTDTDSRSELQQAILKGLGEKAARFTAELLKTEEPLGIVQNEIIPALNKVGTDFENKRVYLPQLLMSAEAAKASFEEIKRGAPQNTSTQKCRFVIATVKGDIHDIGKNIVKLMLENYGFAVTDLGKDVPPEKIVDTVLSLKAPVVGLSALMTTTVPAMEETVKKLKIAAPWCKIVVGGAVLNKEYADAIGADKYAADAMETVRYAEEINRGL